MRDPFCRSQCGLLETENETRTLLLNQSGMEWDSITHKIVRVSLNYKAVAPLYRRCCIGEDKQLVAFETRKTPALPPPDLGVSVYDENFDIEMRMLQDFDKSGRENITP